MTRQGEIKILRIGIYASILVIASILLSGPLGMPLVLFTKSQPSWASPEIFVENFHYIQTLPYFFGFLLTIGSILIVTSTYKLASEEVKANIFPSIIFASIYASLISLNYIIQTTFIPALATHYSPDFGVIITSFSMSSPYALAWAIEMYGYAFLSLSTLWIAPFFKNQKSGRFIRWLLVVNAVVSIVGAILTSFDLSWVLTYAGLAGFFIWNILYLIIAVLILITFRRRLTSLLEK